MPHVAIAGEVFDLSCLFLWGEACRHAP